MGKRGPKPQPAELKKARGNPGKRAVKATAQSIPMVHECPEDLADIRATWDHYGTVLARMGILQDSDGIAWETLWRTWRKYLEAAKSDDPQMAGKELQYGAALLRLLDHFGMSPSARGSIEVAPPKEKSEFEKFLEKKKATG